MNQFTIEEEAEGEDEDATGRYKSQNMTLKSTKFKKKMIKAHPLNTELAPVHETKPKAKASPKPRKKGQLAKGSDDDDFITPPKVKAAGAILKKKKVAPSILKGNKPISLIKPQKANPNKQVIRPEYVIQKLTQKDTDNPLTDPATKTSDDDTRELKKKPKKKLKKLSGLDQEGSRRVARENKNGLDSGDLKKSVDPKKSRSKSKKNKLEAGLEQKSVDPKKSRSKSKKKAPEDGVEIKPKKKLVTKKILKKKILKKVKNGNPDDREDQG